MIESVSLSRQVWGTKSLWHEKDWTSRVLSLGKGGRALPVLRDYLDKNSRRQREGWRSGQGAVVDHCDRSGHTAVSHGLLVCEPRPWQGGGEACLHCRKAQGPHRVWVCSKLQPQQGDLHSRDGPRPGAPVVPGPPARMATQSTGHGSHPDVIHWLCSWVAVKLDNIIGPTEWVS